MDVVSEGSGCDGEHAAELAAAEDPDGGTGQNGGGIRHEAGKMEGGQGWLKSGVRWGEFPVSRCRLGKMGVGAWGGRGLGCRGGLGTGVA